MSTRVFCDVCGVQMERSYGENGSGCVHGKKISYEIRAGVGKDPFPIKGLRADVCGMCLMGALREGFGLDL